MDHFELKEYQDAVYAACTQDDECYGGELTRKFDDALLLLRTRYDGIDTTSLEKLVGEAYKEWNAKTGGSAKRVRALREAAIDELRKITRPFWESFMSQKRVESNREPELRTDDVN